MSASQSSDNLLNSNQNIEKCACLRDRVYANLLKADALAQQAMSAEFLNGLKEEEQYYLWALCDLITAIRRDYQRFVKLFRIM